ncbi:MAG: AAA family ATPase, partial [Emcibacteraceae bacterium]|nr:AAA family ATPase [Emcibacteraceae bacterium]
MNVNENKKTKESLVERAARKLAENKQAPDIQSQTKTANGEFVKQAGYKRPEAGADPVMAHGEKIRDGLKDITKVIKIDEDRLNEKNILTLNNDNVLVAEEFRLIKRSLLINAFTGGDNAIENGNIIMVTSSQPNEGKTYCSLSLALSMAKEKDLNVLLVDADVAKPDIMNTVGVKGGKGLIDVIGDENIDLSDCILKTDINNLSILPAGKKHSFTTELLASEKMGNLIDELAQRYHDRVIVIDSPPVLASSASSVLAMHVGQILFVVEADRTTEEEVKEALQLI